MKIWWKLTKCSKTRREDSRKIDYKWPCRFRTEGGAQHYLTHKLSRPSPMSGFLGCPFSEIAKRGCSERGRMQKHGKERTWAQKSANASTQKSVKERQRAQKNSKERKRAQKSAKGRKITQKSAKGRKRAQKSAKERQICKQLIRFKTTEFGNSQHLKGF